LLSVFFYVGWVRLSGIVKTSYSKINFPMVKLNILAAAWHQTQDCKDSDITNLLVVWAL